jgi:hypothetical protein
MGGAGGHPMIPCAVPTDCPGKENECAHRTCEGGLCGMAYTASGTAVAQQNTGDCKKIICDGHGNLDEAHDDTDLPDDSNPCTDDVCTSGIPGHTPAKVGKSCGGTLTCDGNGNCTGCTAPGDCPGTDSECQTRSCTNSICGFLYKPAGTAVTTQTPGDCKQNVCNGSGQISTIADATDPQDDGNPCTTDSCSNGSPAHTNAAAGAPCTTSAGGTVCDGGGVCVECLAPTNCPGQDDECQTRTCSAGKCGLSYQPMGTVVSIQSPGDCKKNVCDGHGAVTAVPDDGDVQDDGNICTSDGCSAGTATHAPTNEGTACGANKKCMGGSCTGCTGPTDCPGTDNACQSRTCTNGVCGMSYVAAGTPVGGQTAGDCKKNACDGAGNTVVMVDNGDVPNDGNACTSDLCSNGTPSNPPSGAGTSCGTTGVCNGAGVCGVCAPGDYRDCCGAKSTACCYQTPQSLPGEAQDVSVSDETPDLICCCGATQDCDSNGQWGPCL